MPSNMQTLARIWPLIIVGRCWAKSRKKGSGAPGGGHFSQEKKREVELTARKKSKFKISARHPPQWLMVRPLEITTKASRCNIPMKIPMKFHRKYQSFLWRFLWSFLWKLHFQAFVDYWKYFQCCKQLCGHKVHPTSRGVFVEAVLKYVRLLKL